MKHLLRDIPSVNRVVEDLQPLEFPRVFLVKHVRSYLENLRKSIVEGLPPTDGKIDYEKLIEEIKNRLLEVSRPRVCRALNATGIVLHTGLGRAVLPGKAIEAIEKELKGYAVVEVDRETGERTIRDGAVQDMLCALTHAEDSTVVNNNAGAILLVLAALARGKEVIVSRGQLVEIGGSFRVPEVMAESGARLVEVGCTNRTHLLDYEKAITPDTVAILRVHTSNYKICGFTHEVSVQELSQLARSKNLHLIEDAGSGAMMDFSRWGIEHDPIVPDSIAKGADIVTFSGDKLLGSCQAGIIVGRRKLVEKIRKHPLARALRVDKVTLSILESTLKIYENESIWADIPTVAMLTVSASEIKSRAERMAADLKKNGLDWEISVCPSIALAGSGSFPTQPIESYAVFLKSSESDRLTKMLRLNDPPVFVRIQDGSIVVDPRTLLPGEDLQIVEILCKTMNVCERSA